VAAERPHFLHPFTRNGTVGVVEQDTLEHVDSCCRVIVSCPTGFRDERPEFGWPFPEFTNVPIDTQAVSEAIRRFEPRARSVRAEEYADAAVDAVRHISITVEATE
jgi:phage baseplate assembly protein W